MGAGIKSLVKDTAVYGLSNMLGRFLNWALVPLYVNTIATQDYGIVTNLYAWVALLLIFLTYGMETGFFRYVNQEPNPEQVYANSLKSIGTTSTLFIILSLLFIHPISSVLGYAQTPQYVAMLVVIASIDAFLSIPFAYLRHNNRPFHFAALKIGYILLTVGLNLFFLLLCPWLMQRHPSWVSWFYDSSDKVAYIFISNLIANVLLLIVMLPLVKLGKGRFDFNLLKRMLRYSLPIVLLGLAGNFNKMADKIIFPYLYDNIQVAQEQLGIYAAGYKLAIIIVIMTQAFRFAYEPFIFKKKKGRDLEERQTYAMVMKYYIITSIGVYLCVLAGLDLLKFIFSNHNYYEGLKVVPIVMMGEILFGIYYNLSLWYKLTDRTIWGGIISTIGCSCTVAIIIFGVPKWGFMACAWASLVSNMLMMLLSYAMGRKYYPVPYQIKNALIYMLIGGICTAGMLTINKEFGTWIPRVALNGLIALIFFILVIIREREIKQLLLKVIKRI